MEDRQASTELLAETLKDLLAVEEKSIAQKDSIERIVEELNEAVPDLALAYDREKDALVGLTEAELDAALSRAEAQEEYQAQVDRLTELYAERTEIEARLGEAEAALAEAQQSLNLDRIYPLMAAEAADVQPATSAERAEAAEAEAVEVEASLPTIPAGPAAMGAPMAEAAEAADATTPILPQAKAVTAAHMAEAAGPAEALHPVLRVQPEPEEPMEETEARLKELEQTGKSPHPLLRETITRSRSLQKFSHSPD